MGRKGGMPAGTTVRGGYKTGQSGWRLGKNITFLGDLPSEWDNPTNDLLSECQRIKQQRIFDRKSLGVGVCYNCGHVLWSTVGGTHTFLVDKPSNMTREDAPASAYLRAVLCPLCIRLDAPARNVGTVVAIVRVLVSLLKCMWDVCLVRRNQYQNGI